MPSASVETKENEETNVTAPEIPCSDEDEAELD